MHKKSAILLTSLFLLAACGGEDTPETDASSEEPTTEAVTETEAETQTETNNDVHTYDRLVNETTFTEEYGYQAWNDYQAVIKDATFGEFTAITGENSNPEALTGTAKGEVEALFNALDLRDDVIVDEAEVTEKENLVFYRYPPAEESAYSEAALFLAESTFYFYEDNLMFSAITPGFYSLEFNEVPPAEDLMLFLTVDEIKELDSQIYTIAEMQINGQKIQQVMVPAMATDEEGNDLLAAFYFFTQGEDILKYAFLPFELVSQDFATGSLLVFQEMIPEFENM